MANTRTPWLLQGRTGQLIERWLSKSGWELHRVIKDDYGAPLARVRIQPGRAVRSSDVTDVR